MNTVLLLLQAFQPMGKCAKEVMTANGFGEKINLIHARSTDITVGTGELLIKLSVNPAAILMQYSLRLVYRTSRKIYV